MYADELLRPWYRRLVDDLPSDLRVVDAHTHTGRNDPDGYRCSAEQLLAALDEVGGRAVVFSLHEPHGYPPANDRVLAEADASAGRLTPFCRLDPHSRPHAEAERCLAAGARGIKLHPRAEGFGLDHPGVEEVMALADERRLPVLVHAGRGIPALGRHALELAGRHPGARLILAHAGICDLSWLWRRACEQPNLFFDTAWWSPSDLLALLALVPPGQVLFASDAPYGTPLQALTMVGRCALQLGLGEEQIRGLAGGQVERLLRGEEPLALGPAAGPPSEPLDLLLERVCSLLFAAIGRLLAGGDAAELLALARLACEVGDGAPEAPVCRSVLALLDRYERFPERPAEGRRPPGLHLVLLALTVARTPAVGLPVDPEAVAVGEREA